MEVDLDLSVSRTLCLDPSYERLLTKCVCVCVVISGRVKACYTTVITLYESAFQNILQTQLSSIGFLYENHMS